MKKNIIKISIVILILLSIMFAEYRYIMHNLKPYRGDRGTIYIEMFGQIDEYYAEQIDR